jgi:hypothetical protein
LEFGGGEEEIFLVAEQRKKRIIFPLSMLQQSTLGRRGWGEEPGGHGKKFSGAKLRHFRVTVFYLRYS